MTIYSAHFAYSPRGGLIKFPYLRLDEQRKVIGIEGCGDAYVEVHSAQFFNGLLIPGFVADFRKQIGIFNNRTELKRKVTDFYFSGTAFVIFPTSIPKSVLIEMPVGPTIICDDALPLLPDINCSPWEYIKGQSISAQIPFAQALHLFYANHWSLVSEMLMGGDFLPGMKPGVNCVSGIDWETGLLNPNATLKLLQ